MIKFLLKFLFLLFVFLILVTVYISFFGIETDKFNNLIKEKANKVNRYVKLEFNKTKIHLNPKELNLVVKLKNPKILAKENEIILSKFDLFLPLESFFTSDFLLKRVELAFSKNDIKDLTKITNIFLPRIINKQINKVFNKGTLEGEFTIPFKSDGTLGKNYGFSGKILNSSINVTKKIPLKNLTLEIKNVNKNNFNGFEAVIKNGSIYDLELGGSVINLIFAENTIETNSSLVTKGKIDHSQLEKLLSLSSIKLDKFKNTKGEIDLNTNINFNLSKNFKIKNLSYSTKGDIPYFEIETAEKKIIKKYLPDYNPKVVIKNSKINLINSKSNRLTNLVGAIKTNGYFDSFQIK